MYGASRRRSRLSIRLHYSPTLNEQCATARLCSFVHNSLYLRGGISDVWTAFPSRPSAVCNISSNSAALLSFRISRNAHCPRNRSAAGKLGTCDRLCGSLTLLPSELTFVSTSPPCGREHGCDISLCCRSQHSGIPVRELVTRAGRSPPSPGPDRTFLRPLGT